MKKQILALADAYAQARSECADHYNATANTARAAISAALDDADNARDKLAAPFLQELTDADLLQCLKSVDPETARLPPGFRDFARAVLAAANK
jgi:hypothetical protein